MLRIDDKYISCEKPSDFNIITLPNNVRSPALHMSSFVCSFLSLRLKFHTIFLVFQKCGSLFPQKDDFLIVFYTDINI